MLDLTAGNVNERPVFEQPN